MRKFFSLIAAVLFAGSMMADPIVINASDVTTIASGATSGLDVTLQGINIVWQGAYYNSDGGDGGSASVDFRVYASKSMTLTAESNISKVEIAGYCKAGLTVTANAGTITTGASYASETTKGTLEDPLIVVDEIGATSVTLTCTKQVRAYTIRVTLGEGGDPVEPTMAYYVAGSMTNWGPMAAYKLAANPANKGEYMGEFTFAANDEFKVGYSDGITIESTNYFPNGMDNNYVITEAGDYTVYFRPDGQGGEDWHYGCINAIKKESPAAISCLEVYQKAKNDAVLLNPVTVTYSNGANVWVMDGSASMLIYLPSGFTNNFQAGDVLSGVAGTVDIYQNIVYEVKPDATQAAAITVTSGEAPAPSQAAVIEASDVNKYVILPGFSIEGAFTADAKTSLPAVLGENTVTIYNNFKFAYTFEAGKTYNITGVVSAYKGNPQVYFISAEEAGGEVPPTPSINYYVIGSMTEWNVDENYKLVANPAVEGEYMGEFTFANNDEFKITGDDGSQLIWYPGGTDNNFKITEDGDYKITFNPAGNVEGWYEGYFNVVKKVLVQYEVAEAIAAGLADDTEIEVRGVVTKIQIKGKNFAKYGSACIYVKDATDAEGEFEFFNCYSFDAAKFTSTVPAYDETSTAWADLKKVVDENGNEFRLGDTIVALGKYQYYNQKTHQLQQGCYIVDIKHAPVAPAQDIEVNMSEGLRFVDYVAAEGWWELYGADDKYIIDLSNVSTEQIAGEYPIDNLDPDYRYLGIINGEDTTYVTFVNGAITLTVSENGDVTVTGTLVGDDDNSYVLNLAYVVPTAKEEVSVIIAKGELYDEMADYGLYAIFGEDETVYVQLAIWVEEALEGIFTEADLDLQNIGSFIYDGEEYVEIYSATITVTPADGGGYNIVATILGYNNKQYTITMTIPAQEEGIEETLAAGKAAKVLRDGQVLILKGDKTFNVMGTVVR